MPLPAIELVKLLPSQFQEYLDIFSHGGLGYATPPADMHEMLEGHKNGSEYFKIVCKQELIEVKKGTVVGACGMALKGNIGFIFNQYVIPTFREHGFGGASRFEREKLLRERGAKIVLTNINWRFWKQMKRLMFSGYRPTLHLPKIKGKRHITFRKHLL